MTTTAMPAPAQTIPPLTAYGPILTDTKDLADMDRLVGGDGPARWKQLVYGMHLPGPWGTVEYVELLPGSSCGRHLHGQREEIYYILGGDAEMYVNGEEYTAAAGKLITCTLGTVHGIAAPAGAAEPLRFFVVELEPGQGPPPRGKPIDVGERTGDCAGYRGYEDYLRVARVDLQWDFTGPWRSFAEIEVPPGDTLGPWTSSARTSEVLFVAAGQACITAGPLSRKGGPGLCSGTGPSTEVTIENLDATRPLNLISTVVNL